MPRKVNSNIRVSQPNVESGPSAESAGPARLVQLKKRVATLEATLERMRAIDPLNAAVPTAMKLFELEEKIKWTKTEIRNLESSGDPKPEPQTGYATDDLLMDPNISCPTWDPPAEIVDYSSLALDSLGFIAETLV